MRIEGERKGCREILPRFVRRLLPQDNGPVYFQREVDRPEHTPLFPTVLVRDPFDTKPRIVIIPDTVSPPEPPSPPTPDPVPLTALVTKQGETAPAPVLPVEPVQHIAQPIVPAIVPQIEESPAKPKETPRKAALLPIELYPWDMPPHKSIDTSSVFHFDTEEHLHRGLKAIAFRVAHKASEAWIDVPLVIYRPDLQNSIAQLMKRQARNLRISHDNKQTLRFYGEVRDYTLFGFSEEFWGPRTQDEEAYLAALSFRITAQMHSTGRGSIGEVNRRTLIYLMQHPNRQYPSLFIRSEPVSVEETMQAIEQLNKEARKNWATLQRYRRTHPLRG